MLTVHPGGCYAWREQPHSPRAQEDQRLLGLIKQSWIECGAVYGYRKIYDDLRELVLRGDDFRGHISTEPVSTSVVQTVGVDPGAIGYASVYFRTARTRVLPVQNTSSELAQPEENDASSEKYPLAHNLYMYLGASKEGTANAAAREFIRFVLSEESQNIARANGAFAITAAIALAQHPTLGK